VSTLSTAVAAADEVKYVLLVIGGLIVAGLEIWRRMSRARTDTAVDTADRRRLTDAISDASTARKEAHDVKNEMMGMQKRMGGLEAQNDWLKEAKTKLEKENEDLRDRIAKLERQMRSLNVPYDPSKSISS